MKKITSLLCFVIILILSISSVSHAEEKIRIITEEYPPYNFVDNNQIKGLSVDVIKAIFNEARVPYYIEVRSWDSAYNETITRNNTFLFSTVKTSERLDIFQFIGPIAPLSCGVYAIKPIEIKNLKQMMKYKTGTTAEDFQEKFLLQKGFVKNKNIFSETGNDSNNKNFLKLVKGEIDLLPIPNSVICHLAEKNNYNIDMFKKVYVFDDLPDEGLFLAANRDTSPKLIEKLNNAFLKIKEDGTFHKILLKWNVF